MQLETATAIVTGEQAAREAVAFLVSESAAFTVEPLPDDQWEISVKPDRVRTLRRMAERWPQ